MLVNKAVIKPYARYDLKIYAYTLPQVPNLAGYVKIGETTRDIRTRILEQVGTAGLIPDVLFEKQARRSDGTWFRDKDLHRYLILNGIDKKDINGYANEWFYFDGDVDKAEELTDKYINLDYEEVQIGSNVSDYILRREQRDAVDTTLEYYNSGKEPREFLWNAKPRFGKTLTTYDFVRKIRARNVLIVTNRPAIANSWYDDFVKFISWQEPQYKFVSETDALKDKALTRKEFVDYIMNHDNEETAQIVFISLQDLKGARFAGGTYEKLEWVSGINWDLLIIDEAHEGVDTQKTDAAFEKIKRNFTLHLSGTPFKAIASNKFNDAQIYNWSYLDEQQAKLNWDITHGTNPYEKLPVLSLFTYQMSKMIEETVSKGLALDDDINVDYAFDLNEFFRVRENGKFVYKESVKTFLDNLCSGNYPFSPDKHLVELNHTFWLLPGVASSKAMEKLLREHPVFRDYKVVLAAGDGISIQDEVETFKQNAIDYKASTKSYDKVKKAIEKNEKTITLSCGQLTTGVTIPEWTAVFMLNNVKSPSLYFQAAFRAQNPYEFEKDNKLYRKENAYVFDFAPERTLVLYDELANNLSPVKRDTTESRKNKIRQLLNFFPVIAEDKNGEMHELDAAEVLTIPRQIKAAEVVRRGFMSNLLFDNITGLFGAPKEIQGILDKLKPEKSRRLQEPRKIKITDPYLNDEGMIEIPREMVINKTNDLFGEAIYLENIIPDNIMDLRAKSIVEGISTGLEEGFKNFSSEWNLNKTQIGNLQKNVKRQITDFIEGNLAKSIEELKKIEKEYQEQIRQSDAFSVEELTTEKEEKTQEIKELLQEEIKQQVSKAVEEAVQQEMEKEEEKKKKTTEDDVRDHLRGFTRTIPAFLMAYGNEDTTLANFEENIDPETFEELTSITIDEFKKLRDGFSYVDDEGNERHFNGFFDEAVFNASIKEFFNKKAELADYFDDTIDEDIFDYIPPQKTNQIFTPKAVVEMMVDSLENENPEIFKDRNNKFFDPYTKSGLFIAEIVRRLNKGLKDQIADKKERVKWILENQVYACAPSNIIYNIVNNFIFADFDWIENRNLIECDLAQAAEDGTMKEQISNLFGGKDLKFDVIIGNPPYQDESIGDNKTYTPPIYHLFLDEAYKIADKVLMIHPARFLFNAGSTPKAWNKKMLSDKHLQVVYYESNSANVFPNTDIMGGIAITYRDKHKVVGAIGTFSPFKELRSILEKVVNDHFVSIDTIIHAADSYKFTDTLHNDYPNAESLLSAGHKYDLRSNIFAKLAFIFINDKPEDIEKYYGIYGRENNERVFKWIKREYIEFHPNLLKYKVFVPESNGSGAIGEVINTPVIGTPVIGFPAIGHTQTFISIGAFDTEYEANAALKYVKSKFARTLLGTLKVTQHNPRATWANVPLQDFTPNSDIDWSVSVPEIDRQLYTKYRLNDEEINFIEEKVQAME